MNNEKTVEILKNTIKVESESLAELSNTIDGSYIQAVNTILKCKGKVVISGVGKSGHIGKKIAATFASTGTPAFFMHSTEGVHGDLGMITAEDIVILISNSGETSEVLSLLPTLNKIGTKKISITSNNNSTLGKSSDIALEYTYVKEADHLNLAPTTSSTLTLVIGDSLATAVSQLKKFSKNDFHLYHPGGSLGSKLSEEE